MNWFNLHHGAYSCECISFGLDLLSGNYHFGMLLAIHDQDFWRKYGRRLETNWEVDSRGGGLYSLKDQALLQKLLIRRDWTEDVSVVVEGLRRLHELNPRGLDIPELVVL